MKIQKERFMFLKRILEDTKMAQILMQQENDKKRMEIISDALEYLISTNDDKSFYQIAAKDELGKELNRYSEKMKLTREGNYTLLRNSITDGFLFHGTARRNVENILQNGLKSLNNLYGINFKQKIDFLNDLYRTIYNRNYCQGKNMAPIDILSGVYTTKDRFDSIYLTPYIANALIYAGNYNELARGYIKGLISNFCGDRDKIDYNNLLEVKIYLRKLIKDNDFDVRDEELDLFISFYEELTAGERCLDDTNRALVLVPSSICGLDHFVEEVKSFIGKEELESFGEYEGISSFLELQYLVEDDISPDKLMTLHLNDDKSLSLNMGSKR